MAEVTERENLWDDMQEAFWGAYDAAPSGEGVMGAADFGCHAAILVLREELTPPQAVEKTIGEVGHYGVRRRHELVPREGPGSIAAARAEGRREALEAAPTDAEVEAAAQASCLCDEQNGAAPWEW